jgi:hypothetical protein
MLIAAGFADAIVGRPHYMAGQTDTAWDTAFSCALLLLCVAAFYATMGYWVCGISVS